jgi:hypothetical protein
MKKPPRWARVLLRCLAPSEQADDVVGDLEEAHRRRIQRHGRASASMLTVVETFDMAAALSRFRFDRFWTNKGNSLVQDYKLGLRMLVKFPGLTIAGGLALAIAIRPWLVTSGGCCTTSSSGGSMPG